MFLQLGSVSIGYDSSVDETSCCYLNLNYELATQQNNNENVENETAAELYNPQNGLQLKLWTNQPGLQVFNAPMMNIKPPGLNNLKYSSFAGICLEAQKFPDSVNQHHFPSIIIEPNQSYYQKTEISVNFT